MCPSRDSSTEMHSEDVVISQVNVLRCITTGAVRQGTELLERLIYKMCHYTTRPTKGNDSDHVAHHHCRNGLHASPKRSFFDSIASLLSQTEHTCVPASQDHDTLLSFIIINP